MKVKESEKVGLKLNIQKTKIMASCPIISWQIDGEKMETVNKLYFLGLQNYCRWWWQPWNQKMLFPWKKSYDKPRQHIKSQRHYFADKGPYSQSCGFSSSHVLMTRWVAPQRRLRVEELMLLNCGLGEDSWESLRQQEIKLGNPKGNWPWILVVRTDTETKAPILWPPDAKSQLIRKDPNARKEWGQ